MKSTLVYSLHYMITQHIHFDKRNTKLLLRVGKDCGPDVWSSSIQISWTMWCLQEWKAQSQSKRWKETGTISGLDDLPWEFLKSEREINSILFKPLFLSSFLLIVKPNSKPFNILPILSQGLFVCLFWFSFCVCVYNFSHKKVGIILYTQLF